MGYVIIYYAFKKILYIKIMKVEMKLNLGTGNQPKEGYTNIDILRLKGVDIIHDLDKFPYPFKDNSIDEIYTEYTLEHLKDIIRTLKELYRICKPNATIEIIVPHFTAHRMFGDLTHHQFFSYTSFDNFCNIGDKRNTSYDKSLRFGMIEKRIGFYQKGKKGINTKFLLPLEKIFNLIPTVYERFFCFMIPATQLRFKFKVIKRA